MGDTPEQDRIQKADERTHQALLNAQAQFSDLYSKTVIALAGGGLALSITFVDKMAPGGVAQWKALLVAGWASLLAALLCGLYTILQSLAALEWEVGHFYDTSTKRPENRLSDLNAACAYLVTAGFALLAAFAFVNALQTPKEQETSEMATSKTPAQQQTNLVIQAPGKHVQGSYKPQPKPSEQVQPPAAPPTDQGGSGGGDGGGSGGGGSGGGSK